MKARNRIKDGNKSLKLTQTLAFIYVNTKIFQVLITNSCTNTSFFYFSSFIIKTVTPTS